MRTIEHFLHLPTHFYKEQKKQAFKPDSVSSFRRTSVIYLGSRLPVTSCDLPRGSGEQPSDAGIHGLATRRLYGFMCHHINRWALTPPFHPYPDGKRQDGFFLLHYHTLSDIFPLGSAMLYVVRTFLPCTGQKRQNGLHGAKIVRKIHIAKF